MKNHHASISFVIGRTAHLLRSVLQSALRDVGVDLSNEETQILLVLDDAEEPLATGEFAALMLRDATTLTRQLDSLVAKRCISRTPSASDRRVMLISLTRHGRRTIEQLMPTLLQVRSASLDGISKTAVATTIKTLQKMQKNLFAASAK